MTKKKILITGAGGFIGSHLTEACVRAGHHVKAFVEYNSFNSHDWLDHSPNDIKENCEVILGDVRDPFGVRESMKQCDVVLHLAALIGIPYSYHSPASYIETNINGTLNIVQAARELGVQKVIHTSTSEVYGTAQYVPIDEFHPLQGQSPYSASKIGADQLALSYYTSFETPVTIARPFNTYGPRQSTRAVIPTVITQIANGVKEIKLGSLSPTRDFNFVEDTVGGFIALMENSKHGEVYNIGSNFEISIENTVKVIAETMSKDISIKSDEERLRPENSEVFRLWAENKKVLNETNWKPKYAGIEGFKAGIRKTVEWFCDKNNLKLFKSEMYTI